MIYIGMKPAESTLEELQRELDIAYQKRKQEQASWLPKYRGAKGSATISREMVMNLPFDHQTDCVAFFVLQGS